MKKLKTTLAAGISVALGITYATTILAQQTPVVSSLPVITDDCGETSCADRREFTVEQTLDLLSDAANRQSAMRANANSESSKNERNHGKGYGIGQNDNSTQVVYLNFDQSSPTFQAVVFGGVVGTFESYEYSQEERDEIQANIADRYEGFDVEFTQEQPTDGDFSTLNFECQQGGCIDFTAGILFGRAQSIDIRNENRNDSAFVDANLWQVFAELDPSGGLLSNFSGIPINDGNVDAALSQAVVNQASNTGAHELGHNLGLRHHDSFGAPGDGVTPGTGDFFPVFDGPLAALESFDHTMASGASVGTGFADSTVDLRFFSERSALKLAANQRPLILQEQDVTGGNQKVKFRRVLAPNTIDSGENAEGKLELLEARIEGSIDIAGEVDSYRFKAKAGQFLNAEFFGFDTVPTKLAQEADFVIGALALYYVEEDGSLTLVRQNFQNFEGFDALLVDAPLEKDGEYVLQVLSPDLLRLNPDLFISLDATGNGQFRSGNYEVSMYVTNGRPGKGVPRVPGA
ncbi:zinc-dependent metalloprotease family protein [Brumicola nitratireducens]|uniref:Uncharacterized protein n=1 Tax=Glaciecola nitratireducens (strain JCM 12485 / KCTC 12276 / FR1064) TaxID=1085623 RepID=G4QFX8_GLANF|nr:zinc-dependent metalloprotease family protein [Glaciecola nitratireducens]AEP29069.1 hypothetical protein GNIT_0931 [Glaciecola nitratireducens FR1064]